MAVINSGFGWTIEVKKVNSITLWILKNIEGKYSSVYSIEKSINLKLKIFDNSFIIKLL
ncbi:hypothetical protein [Clostridium tyrobutyricum]|uniref:hypothetical protein n=1 Tax=Clostridium tyrobutyricum TaxID=1519 RepID=UPI001C38C8ED|nr:hypothetical protein [Clostridium tyrobutyricum]MBV4428700.1 hypothetical protein [Clostridium tyrobutyricum]MBV4443841.1 hypothetical protein [Clostridium tyrobutyricum]